MDAACALVRTPQVRLVLVDLSAFPAAALCALARALGTRRDVPLLALVSFLSTEELTGYGSEGLAGGEALDGNSRIATRLLRLTGPEQLSVGLRPCRPN
jgi:hypothetical protein